MRVPESFFKGEIRQSFYVEKLMKKAWAAQIEVLHDVDILCKKHNIQYFADFGTLLGAIRHKGFIPWDDDIDICMKREDYIRFCDIVQKELKGQYEIVNIHTDPTWTQMLARITNSKRIGFEEERLKKFHGCPFAVGLDIFPLDYIAPNEEDDKLQCYIIKILEVTINEFKKDEMTIEEKIDTIHSIEKMCGVVFDYNKPLDIQLRKLEEDICMIYKEEESEYLADIMVTHAYRNSPIIHKKEWFESSIEVPFEYTTIQIPIGYEQVLIKEFGENYMQPRIEVCAHSYPFYKEQLYKIYEANGNR